MAAVIWVGIVLCLSQSAMFSGLNLAFFSVSSLRLRILSERGDERARKVFEYRKDFNFLLTTILWGNVAVNVLLALLFDSVMTGVLAFLFSTVFITFIGEIIPQAYFSRHALKMASLLAPVLRFYQILLFPAAKPTALVLDRWLGPEAITYFKEKEFKELMLVHAEAAESDIERVEGRGAINFLSVDDVAVTAEGEILHPGSVLTLPFEGKRPRFPGITPSREDPFLLKVQHPGKKWAVITDPEGEPRLALDTDGFLRDALFEEDGFHPLSHCHRPIVIRDEKAVLGDALPRLRVHAEAHDDDVIDQDLILFWGEEKRIITGSDILGRLLRGISRREAAPGETSTP